MEEEKLRIENAQAYRDYAKFFGTLSSGLFVASGIGASMAAMSLNSGISLMDLGLRSMRYNSLNSTAAANLTGDLLQAGVQSTSGVKFGVALTMILTALAFNLAVEGMIKWNKSQAILNNKEFNSKGYRLGQLMLFLVFLIITFLTLIRPF